MDVRNCRSCGRLFNYMSGPPICSMCQKKLEDKFREVREYLNENPRSSVRALSEAMDVSTKQIKQWTREERLTLSEPGADGINCEHCGEPISSGRFCEKCKASMTNTLNGVLGKPKAPEAKKQESHGNKMRFLQ